MTLGRDDVGEGIDAVFALVDGAEEDLDLARAALVQFFAPGDPTRGLPLGEVELGLPPLFERLVQRAPADPGALHIALVVWVGSRAIIGLLNQSRVYRLTSGKLAEVPTVRIDSAADSQVRSGDTALEPGDRLILADPEVARFVEIQELLQAVHAHPSIADAVDQIALLGNRRGGQTAGAAIVQIGRHDVAQSQPVRTGGRRTLWTVLGIAFVAALLIATAIVFKTVARSGLIAPSNQVAAPTRLTARQVSSDAVLLSWHGPPNSRGYLVHLGTRVYASRTSRLVVAGVLTPGKQYFWRVQARRQTHAGPLSPPARVSMYPVPAKTWRFPALRGPVIHRFLHLLNPKKIAATVVIETDQLRRTPPRTIRLPQNGAVQLELPPVAHTPGLSAMTVRSDRTILAQSVVVRPHQTVTSFGVPGTPSLAAGLPLPVVPHAFVIFMENSDPGEIVHRPVAPYLNLLMKRYGDARRYFGVTHPSLPNYVSSIAGDFGNVFNDWDGNRFNLRTIADQLQNHGLTWKAYMGGLPYPGYAGDRYPPNNLALYERKHDPFMMMNDILHDPSSTRRVVPASQLVVDLKSGKVPTLSFISPDLCHDMHGINAAMSPCPPVKDQLIAAGDHYLATLVPQIMSSSAWKGDSTIFIVWDEGELSTRGCCGSPPGDGGGRVPAIIIARRGVRHYSSTVAYNHYSLLRTLQRVWKLGCLAHTCDTAHVPDMVAFLRRNYP